MLPSLLGKFPERRKRTSAIPDVICSLFRPCLALLLEGHSLKAARPAGNELLKSSWNPRSNYVSRAASVWLCALLDPGRLSEATIHLFNSWAVIFSDVSGVGPPVTVRISKN
jgi:hypothetical protein